MRRLNEGRLRKWNALISQSLAKTCRRLPVQPAPCHKLSARTKSSSVQTPRKVSTDYCGRQLSLETGKIGPLADGVVLARYGDTSVLTSVVSEHGIGESDFLPLQVEYREKSFAQGVIPQTFNGREGGNTDHEILGARVIDRTLRPLFPKGYSTETQIICSVTSIDRDAPPDTVSIAAASAALAVSDIPWHGPAAAVHIGWVDGGPVLNPSREEQEASVLDVLYAGTETRTLMLEVAGEQVPEHQLIAAMRAGQAALKAQCDLQRELASLVGRPKREWETLAPDSDLKSAAAAFAYAKARKGYSSGMESKQQRSAMQGKLQAECIERLKADFSDRPHAMIVAAASSVLEDALRDSILSNYVQLSPKASAIRTLVPQSVHDAVAPGSDEIARLARSAKDGGTVRSSSRGSSDSDSQGGLPELSDLLSEPKPPVVPVSIDSNLEARQAGYDLGKATSGRPDGRSSMHIRQLQCENEVIPVVHGSSLFARGATQALCTTTLGPLSMWQLSNARRNPLAPVEPSAKAFMLHYEFPPYSVNEVGRVGGINRRMVGHGALAQKAVAPVMPRPEEFPYTVRVTSEISGSDGSSSMATVCGASVALMDAGVPLKEHVAGISIGMVSTPELGKLEQGAWGSDGSYRARNASEPTEAAGDSDRSAAESDDLRPVPSGKKALLLTDILGLEDHCGDMDFKIAGTIHGVTAVQLDLKLPGIPLEILESGVWRARAARKELLDRMKQTIQAPKEGLRDTAPRIDLLMVPQSKRGQVVGPGARNLRRIERETNSQLSFYGDTDYLQIFSRDQLGLDLAKRLVEELVLLPSPDHVGALGIVGSPDVPFQHARAAGTQQASSSATASATGTQGAVVDSSGSPGPYVPPSAPDASSLPTGIPFLSEPAKQKQEALTASKTQASDGSTGGRSPAPSIRELIPDLGVDPRNDPTMNAWKVAEAQAQAQEQGAGGTGSDDEEKPLAKTQFECVPGSLVRGRITSLQEFGVFVKVTGAVSKEADSESSPRAGSFEDWPSNNLPTGYLALRNSGLYNPEVGTEIITMVVDIAPDRSFKLNRHLAMKAGVLAFPKNAMAAKAAQAKAKATGKTTPEKPSKADSPAPGKKAASEKAAGGNKKDGGGGTGFESWHEDAGKVSRQTGRDRRRNDVKSKKEKDANDATAKVDNQKQPSARGSGAAAGNGGAGSLHQVASDDADSLLGALLAPSPDFQVSSGSVASVQSGSAPMPDADPVDAVDAILAGLSGLDSTDSDYGSGSGSASASASGTESEEEGGASLQKQAKRPLGMGVVEYLGTDPLDELFRGSAPRVEEEEAEEKVVQEEEEPALKKKKLRAGTGAKAGGAQNGGKQGQKKEKVPKKRGRRSDKRRRDVAGTLAEALAIEAADTITSHSRQ